MHNLLQKVQKWFIDRRLHAENPEMQVMKSLEEFGELIKGVLRNDKEVIKESIGDLVVTLIGYSLQMRISAGITKCPEDELHIADINFTLRYINSMLLTLPDYVSDSNVERALQVIYKNIDRVANYYSLTLEECLEHAYYIIKDRKGKLIDGIWVKEADLKRNDE